MKRVLAVVFALLMLAACAAPAAVTPQDIADVIAELVTVGDFVVAVPANYYWIVPSYNGTAVWFAYERPSWPGTDITWIEPHGHLTLLIESWRSEHPANIPVAILPSELLDMPAEVVQYDVMEWNWRNLDEQN